MVLVSSSVSSNFALLLKAAFQTTVEVQIILCIPPLYCTSDKCACTETEFTTWRSFLTVIQQIKKFPEFMKPKIQYHVQKSSLQCFSVISKNLAMSKGLCIILTHTIYIPLLLDKRFLEKRKLHKILSHPTFSHNLMVI